MRLEAPRRDRLASASLLARVLAAAALSLAAVLGSADARADALGGDEKRIKVTWEVLGIERYPEYLFVAYPYGGCPMGPIPEYYEWNPRSDRAYTNYEVLRPGRRYEPTKFCGTRIYAFKASEFPTEERVLTEDIDFYRLKGYTLTILKGFDELKATDKHKFVERSRWVIPSNVNVAFPTVVSDTVVYDTAHDVLRIVEVTPGAVRIEGVHVVAGVEFGPTKELPYRNGERPQEVGEHSMVLPRPETPVTDGQLKLILAGMGALVTTGLGLSLLRQSRPREARKP
jgi:hypothetical protein